MILFSMQAHDFFENFLFNGRQLHFSEASSMRFRHVHKEFIALLDVPSDRWTLDCAGDLVALVCFSDVFAVPRSKGFHLPNR